MGHYVERREFVQTYGLAPTALSSQLYILDVVSSCWIQSFQMLLRPWRIWPSHGLYVKELTRQPYILMYILMYCTCDMLICRAQCYGHRMGEAE